VKNERRKGKWGGGPEVRGGRRGEETMRGKWENERRMGRRGDERRK